MFERIILTYVENFFNMSPFSLLATVLNHDISVLFI